MKWVFLILMVGNAALAAEMSSYELSIKDHKFNIETLNVKANEKFKLKINNLDSTSEEFESRTLVIEKFIGPKKSITVTLGPLKPGTYPFMGEFHQATAKGQVIAK